MVTRAPIALGTDQFLILILQIRSTRGRPIMDNTPDTRMYTTMLRKYHAHATSSKIPKKIRMFLNVAFIKRHFLLQTYFNFFEFAKNI